MVGQLLKEKRNELGLTQEELASDVGISRTYYADVERGRYNPGLKVLIRLAKRMNLDLNLLIKNDGNTSESD